MAQTRKGCLDLTFSLLLGKMIVERRRLTEKKYRFKCFKSLLPNLIALDKMFQIPFYDFVATYITLMKRLLRRSVQLCQVHRQNVLKPF